MDAMPIAGAPPDLEAAFARERKRLVGLCAHLSGSMDGAEDLAQETLAEAWRNRHKLYDPSGISPWLSAIARHVCARSARERGQYLSRITAAPDGEAWDVPMDGPDIELELERGELAQLLDRAMGYLPVETRAALVERYIEGTPQAQVAIRLSLSEGAVAMRLQRGKLALRRLLTNELRDEAAAYGLTGGGDDQWEASRLWCPLCGKHRLRARLIRASGEFAIRCPGCTPTPGARISEATMPLLHRGTTNAAAGVERLLDWMHRSYYSIAPGGTVRCQCCEQPTPPLVIPARWVHAPQMRHAVVTICAACGHRDRMWLSGVVLSLPAGRRFWRAHGRVRLLGERMVEREGRVVAVVGLEAVGTGDRLEVLIESGTLAVLGVGHGERA